MASVDEVAENVYLIDDQLFSIPKLGSVYLLNEEKKALIESGPATSAKAVLDGIKEVGVRPEDVDYVIVTHIHLDHAGGAGVLLKNMPQAKVAVHHKGAKHIANPAKLLASMIEAQGEKGLAIHGEVIPIESHRLLAIHDEDSIRLSDQQVLKFIDAPGHAPHELCIYESRNNGVFTGDAAGQYIEGVVVPLQAPPNFDLELCINTIRRLKEMKPSIIYSSHFGASNRVQENLQLAIDKLKAWAELVTEAMREDTVDATAERLRAQICAELEPVRKMEAIYEFLTNSYVLMTVAAFIDYYQGKAG